MNDSQPTTQVSTFAEQAPQEPRRFTEIVRPGDRVIILTPHGNRVSGRVVMLNFQHDCAVLNAGGAHGTPKIADRDNTISIKRGNVRIL